MTRRPPRSSRYYTLCPYTTLFRSRIARALEVIRSTRKPLGWGHAHMEGGIGGEIALRPLLLLPPKPWLFERCDRRFEHMLERGAVEEVERLMERRLKPDLPVMRAIGVREIAAWQEGEIKIGRAHV